MYIYIHIYIYMYFSKVLSLLSVVSYSISWVHGGVGIQAGC